MTRRKNNKISQLLVALLALGLSVSMVGSAVAQVEIPEGATIDYAWLNLYVTEARDQEVRVHRITADWQEYVATWNNFGSSYDPVIIASFLADTVGWYSNDVTGVVSDWVDGTSLNYGLLLEQGATIWTCFGSS